MTNRTITKNYWIDDDSDSISDTSTKESEADEDAIYVVDRILAEEKDDEETLYLIRWEGYPLLKSTWEPAKNIQTHETFDEWEAQKARIIRGEAQPFDIVGFNNQLQELITAQEQRHKGRRAKRKRLNFPNSPYGSDAEDSASDKSLAVPESGDEATKSRQEREDSSGLSSPAKRSAQNSQESSEISEGSLLEELVQKVLKRPRSRVQKKTGKPERKRDYAKASPTSNSSSYRDAPPPTAPDVKAQKPRRRGKNFSRTSYKGSANRDATASGTIPWGRSSAATRGSTQIQGHGAIARNVNFTGIKFTAERTAKQKRSLTNSILKAHKSCTTGQSDHFKTLHMVRKVELGGRALADRAPDMEDVGPLRAPSEYAGPRHNRIKSQEPVLEGLRKKSRPEQNSPRSSPRDLNSTKSLIGQKSISDHDDHIILHDEPNNFVGVAENANNGIELGRCRSSTSPESQKQPALTTQMENRHVNTLIHNEPQQSGNNLSDITEFNLSTGLPIWTPNGPHALIQDQGQRIARRNESIHSGLVAQPVEKPLPGASTEIFSESQSRWPSNGKVQIGQGLSSKSVTKMRLSEYRSRQVSDPFGNAISVQAIFGVKSTQPLLIAFAETNKFSDQPWILALRDIKSLVFTKALIAQDLEPQAEVLQSSFLARGNVIADVSGTLSLKEVAENMRPCLGLLFQHSNFNILIFPGRCEEWKFLEASNTDQDSVLQYQIYSQPCAAAINNPSPTVSSINKNLSSLVELSHSLSYKALVPRCKDGHDIPNFYLLFPRKETESANLLTAWLRSNNRQCKIFINWKSGSWKVFCSHSRVNSGAVIIHSSLLPLVSKMSDIEQILVFRASFYFWCFEDGSSESFYSSISGEEVKMVRLFPHGGAVMLTPSFLLTQPQKTHELLVWFRSKITLATPGTWKIVLPHNSRQLLLDLAIKKRAEGVEMKTYSFWFLSHHILSDLMREESMENFPDSWGIGTPYEGECPIVYADQSIKLDDEIALANWYAGWTMLHLNLFRKFIIVGTKPDNTTPHMPERKSFVTRSGPSSLENTHVGNSAPAKSDAQWTTAPISSTKKWKRGTFTVAKDSSLNAEPEPPILTRVTPTQAARKQDWTTEDGLRERGSPPDVSDERGDMTSGSQPSHGIDETLNKSILEFIVITGANREEAERLVNKYDGDVDIAASNYLSSAKPTPSAPGFPQLDGMQETELTTLLDFPLSSDAMKRISSQSQNLALDDMQRAKDLYGAIHEPLVPPSQIPTNDDGSNADEDLSGKLSIIASGAVVDEITKRTYTPKSGGTHGSVESEINIHTGYVPPEDKLVNKNRRFVADIPQYEDEENTITEARSRSVSSGPSPVETETEQDSAEGRGTSRNSTILYTTEWYNSIKKTHKAWEHIYVRPWDECFKILKVKSKA